MKIDDNSSDDAHDDHLSDLLKKMDLQEPSDQFVDQVIQVYALQKGHPRFRLLKAPLFLMGGLGLALLLPLIVSLAGIIRDNPTPRLLIRHDTDISEYRKIASQPQFDCVGRYASSEESEDYAVGVLIAKDWVLTASHFVEDSSVWFFGGEYYRTQKIFRHPTLDLLPDDRPAQWDGVDLALIKLDRNVKGVRPAVLYQGEAEEGMIITKIGYGYAGDGLAGLNSPRSQERLGGQNTIDLVGGEINGIDLSANVLVCDFDNPQSDTLNLLGSPVPLPLEIGGSKGDSGGGVFFCDTDTCQLVGIVSGALNRQIKYGSLMAFARVSTARLWIEKVVSSAP
ncbi:MAG: trypsin-like serine protease [Bacteroidota bacterium]